MFKHSALSLVVFFVLCSQTLHVHTLGDDREPICSKFHYEEQLLEKMIRLEIKFQTLLDGVKELETSVKSDLIALKEERSNEKDIFANFKKDNENAFKKFESGITKFTEDQERKLGRLSAELIDIRYQSSVSLHLNTIEEQTNVVAFEAHIVTERGPSNGAIVIFAETKVNRGGGYDNSTGIFTAPRDGVYLLMVKFCLQDSSYFYFDIMVNRELRNAGQFSSHPSYYSCYSTHAVVDVKSGDTVWVQGAGRKDSLTLYNSRHHMNTFSGFLIG